MNSSEKVLIGIVGFGHLGQYIYEHVQQSSRFQVVWVWNRTCSAEAFSNLPEELKLKELSAFAEHEPAASLIVEVAHPSITKEYGALFLQHADYFIGSPTCFADRETEEQVRASLAKFRRCAFVPTGAMWGAQDIQKMATIGSLTGLKVTMKKHPSSLKLQGYLHERVAQVLQDAPTGEVVLFEGPVRELCPLAPNNVNTMAVAALAAHNLGLDKVIARLVADHSLTAHVIDIEVQGPDNGAGESFRVLTTRYNPAAVGAVTGSATYTSFWASLQLTLSSRQPGEFSIC